MRVPLGPRRLTLEVSHWNAALSGPPLVILHGFLEQGAAWQEVAHLLDRPVYAPDQRGHGKSDHVGAGGFYHFWDYVSDLDALLDNLSPSGPVNLLGHSMGGTVASLYAGTRPERIRRLVLVEGLGPPDTEHSAVTRARQFLRHQRVLPTHGDPFTTVEAAAARMRRHNPAIAETAALNLARRQLNDTENGLEWAWDALHRSRTPNPFVERQFIKFLQEITAPTLVVFGRASGFPGVERAEHLSSHRVKYIEGAAHLVHHDAPQALADLIETHLQGDPWTSN